MSGDFLYTSSVVVARTGSVTLCEIRDLELGNQVCSAFHHHHVFSCKFATKRQGRKAKEIFVVTTKCFFVVVDGCLQCYHGELSRHTPVKMVF